MPEVQRGRPRKERWNLYLPPQTLDQLYALSEQTGLTMAEHVRRAVDEYLRLHPVVEVTQS